MKRLQMSLAAVLFAGIACFALSACGSSDRDPAAEAKAFRGVEVTREQWDAAFDTMESADLEITVDYIVDVTAGYKRVDPETGKEVTATWLYLYTIQGVKQGAKEYMSEVGKTSWTGDAGLIADLADGVPGQAGGEYRTEVYGEQTEDGYFLYSQNENGNWTKEEEDSGLLAIGILLERLDYDDFHYDAEQMGYVGETDFDSYVVKFDSSGKIVACIMDQLPGDDDGYDDIDDYSLTSWKQLVTRFFTYEAKDITLPTV